MPTASSGADLPETGSWWLAPRLARALAIVLFAGLAMIPLLRVIARSDSARGPALAVPCLVAVLAVQLWFLGRPEAICHSPAGAGALLAQSALVALPYLEFGRSWAGVPGFLAGSCLLALPRLAALLTFGVVVVGTAAIQAVLTGDPVEVTYAATSTAIGGLLVWGLTRLAGLVEELRDSRTEVARLAVAGERLRVSRDLHDLIGSSISAITLKSELTARLIGTSPDRAYEEISEVVDISRRTLDDVRSVARGYRQLPLREEVLLARSMLLAADVTTQVDDSGVDEVPRQLETVLGIVLREGVTNALRHSRATVCRISLRRVEDRIELEIVNDGVVGGPAPCPDRGTGLDSLAARVAAVSGWLSAELLSGGRWRLCATIGLVPAPRRVAGATVDRDGFCDVPA
ncbi:MAG TPA: histidine kinase [Mycobacteriales bacterium]|nr:histidine kinase [Mycobacteriales bacterium]